MDAVLKYSHADEGATWQAVYDQRDKHTKQPDGMVQLLAAEDVRHFLVERVHEPSAVKAARARGLQQSPAAAGTSGGSSGSGKGRKRRGGARPRGGQQAARKRLAALEDRTASASTERAVADAERATKGDALRRALRSLCVEAQWLSVGAVLKLLEHVDSAAVRLAGVEVLAAMDGAVRAAHAGGALAARLGDREREVRRRALAALAEMEVAEVAVHADSVLASLRAPAGAACASAGVDAAASENAEQQGFFRRQFERMAAENRRMTEELSRIRPHRDWDAVLRNLHSAMDAERRAMGSWSVARRLVVRLERSDVVPCMLRAFSKASKKELVRAATEVRFQGELGVDQGGPTREMWHLFRKQLFAHAAASANGERQHLFEQLSEDEAVSARVPAAACTSEQQLAQFHAIGRVFLKALLEQQLLPPGIVALGSCSAQGGGGRRSLLLSYLAAPDDEAAADRSAIGTCGVPQPAQAEAEAREALAVLRHHSPGLATTFTNLLDDEERLEGSALTLGDILGSESALPMGSRAQRAAAVCWLVHERLLEVRRPQLRALKAGFLSCGVDLRGPLQLFLPQELVSLR